MSFLRKSSVKLIEKTKGDPMPTDESPKQSFNSAGHNMVAYFRGERNIIKDRVRKLTERKRVCKKTQTCSPEVESK